jgi:predicted MFS family arabinose efflux permease
MIPAGYRDVLGNEQARRLLAGLGVSALGDGMSMVSVAWLAVLVAPAGSAALFVGLAVAAYTLPGAAGALALGRFLRRRAARSLVVCDTWLRAGCLVAITLLWTSRSLTPFAYLGLLAGSSVLSAWGSAGQYTLLSELGGPDGRLAANSLYTAQASLAVIAGPALAGLLVAPLGTGSLLGLDAASFAFLGVQAWRTRPHPAAADSPVDVRAAESGFQLLRRLRLISLITVTWLFFFLYGPVEDALPIYVARDLHAGAGMLGAYWACFGLGALVSALVTGMLRNHDIRRVTAAIIAGWGACLLPFAFAPAGLTLACFAAGGLIYGPFIPLTYTLLQSSVPSVKLPMVLAARSAVVMIASPLGTAVGGPIVAALGAARTLTASGVTTVVLAIVACLMWTRGSPGPGSPALTGGELFRVGRRRIRNVAAQRGDPVITHVEVTLESDIVAGNQLADAGDVGGIVSSGRKTPLGHRHRLAFTGSEALDAVQTRPSG